MCAIKWYDRFNIIQVAITSMTNFPCLLMFNFQYAALLFNIFDTEVMSVLAKISMCIYFKFSGES